MRVVRRQRVKEMDVQGIITPSLSKSEMHALISKSDTVFVSRALFISTRGLFKLLITNFGS